MENCLALLFDNLEYIINFCNSFYLPKIDALKYKLLVLKNSFIVRKFVLISCKYWDFMKKCLELLFDDL